MLVSDAFPSKYLRAADLQGRTTTLTIEKVVMEDLNGDQKPVVYFADTKKGLVLNVTNARAIAQLAGDDMSNWSGMPLELFSTPVSFQGRTVDAIRVRPLDPARKNKAPIKAPAPDDPNDPLDL